MYQYNSVLENSLNSVNFNISSLGRVNLDTYWNDKNALADFSRIYFITEGNAYLKTKEETIIMKPGYCYFIPCEYSFAYGCDSSFQKMYFHINMGKEECFDVFSGFNRIAEFPMKDEIELLGECIDKEDACSLLTVKNILISLIIRISREYNYSLDSSQKYSDTMLMAIRYIKSHLSAKLSRREVAEHCNVSESTISKLFPKEKGITLGKYIDMLVIDEARQRLITTNDRISKISSDLGFADQYYFSNCIKKSYNMSPSELRKNHNQNGISISS